MLIEQTLARFVVDLQAEQVPESARQVLRHMVLAVAGTGVAGAAEDGIAALRDLMREAGGAPQATTLVFGDRLPAHAAAQFNATMCRALDYCDAMAPGPHIGSALFPAALAAAELAGGCSGSEFMAALAAGAELSSRFNLSEAQYDGFDPTGIAVVFSAAAAASRVMKLTPEQTLHALALAFNRCGGSFQSHVDGSLGVRFVQGWVAEAGVQCAQLAKRGVTGPVNFLSGHYGYAHLYGRDTLDVEAIADGLGEQWLLHRMVFKKYPSCGVTQGVTELTLGLVAEGLRVEDVQSAEVRLPPYAHKLVGKVFDPGSNPRVDAQFNAGYCVANALVRRSSKIAHFSPAEVNDAELRKTIDRITVVADAGMNVRGHAAVDLNITRTDGSVVHRELDTPPGFPGADLTAAQHLARFNDCLAYAPQALAPVQVDRFLAALAGLEAMDDVRGLIPLLVAPSPSID
ncbi:MAG: MmgE/PrpD family protein [Rhizobacter sp.]|nr:MmgE/PrpD family protein [Rhizobacter sp.]